MSTLSSPHQLWRKLQADAGLELRRKKGAPGRDADVEDALRLALAVPPKAASLDAWLAADAVSPSPFVTIEQLLVAVLTSQRGYASMMRDILDMLVTADAQHAHNSISAQFRFDQVSDPIRYTLAAFREAVERIENVLASRFELPVARRLWDLRRELGEIAPDNPKDFPPDFPLVLDPPQTGHTRIDAAIGALTELAAEFRSWCSTFGETRQKAIAAVGRQYSNLQDPAQSAIQDRVNASSDFWDVTVLDAVQQIARRIEDGSLAADNATRRLEPLLASIERRQHWITRTFSELLDVLNLPTWRHRHELYSVWVGSVLLRTAKTEADDIRFHPVGGILSFAFGGSRLATYDRDGEQFDVWAELRSALVGSSSKRKKGIQPDFRVLQAGIISSPNVATRLVLECKHYLNPHVSNFAQAAADYSRSCPAASVLVVNHGPADNDALLASVDLALRGRIKFIGDATADNERRSASIYSAIQQTLFPVRPALAVDGALADGPAGASSPNVVAGAAGTIQLRWDDSLADIDLALEVLGRDGSVTQRIDYRSRGDLISPPFARLETDVREGPGEERIEISAWNFDHYALIATNYSKTGELGPGHVDCEVRIGSTSTVLSCPKLGHATEWRIATIEVQDGIAHLFPMH